ncbi:MAG TPA: hypothetical protein VF763_00230 [Candidatus Limnocylindrales bacterium]
MAASSRYRVRIRIRGELGPSVAALFEELAPTPGDDGTTLLEGEAVDQAAVHGLIDRIRDLGLRLVTVESEAIPTAASQNGDQR